MKINPEKFIGKATKFIRKTVAEAGFEKAIVAISGGVDSAATLALCVEALGAEHVLAVMLPCGKLGGDGVERALEACGKFKLPKRNRTLVDISSMIAPFLARQRNKNDTAGSRRTRAGNIMARVRMIVLYDLARENRALVCGTENKSEYLLGYFTRFGDEASDLEPIRNLYKTQVYRLAKYLGVPEKILKTSPTAGLWEGQTDERELGFSYEEADPILRLFSDKKMGMAEIVRKGYRRDLVEKVRSRMQKNEFKHELPHVFVFRADR